MMAQEIVTAVQEGHQAHDRPARQPRLREHRRAVASRSAAAASARATGIATRRPASSTAMSLPVDFAANAASLGAQRRSAPTRSPRCASALAATRDRPAHVGDRRPGRSRGARRRLRIVVGRAGRRSVDDRRGPGARAPRGKMARQQGARLPVIRVANAPCSWGVLEFEAPSSRRPAAQVLDEMAAAGYAGTELGDWGFLPTDPAALAADVGAPRARARRRVRAGRARPGRRARRGHRAGGADGAAAGAAAARTQAAPSSPVIVLSDDNTTRPEPHGARRTHPRRGRPDAGRSGTRSRARAERVAAAVRDATGLRTVFHHHCAGYVETPREIDALMSRTDPDAARPLPRHRASDVRRRQPGRCASRSTAIASGTCTSRTASRSSPRQARAEAWDYHTAVRRGIFCELGQGMVPFAQRAGRAARRVLRRLDRRRAGRPARPRDAGRKRARNREYLRRPGALEAVNDYVVIRASVRTVTVRRSSRSAPKPDTIVR